MRKTALAALAATMMCGSAQAAVLPVTFNPGTVVPGASQFTADTLNFQNFSRTDLTGNSYTQAGYLQLNNVSLGGNTFNPAGNRSAYSIYLQYSLTGTQSLPNFNLSSTGTDDSFDYTLYEVAGGSAFGIDSNNNPFVNNNGSNLTALATGSLTRGTYTFSANPLGAGGSISATFAQQLAGFIVSPKAGLNTQFSMTANPNTVTVLNNGQTFTLNGSGASETFSASVAAVPEPASWAMMLVGFGMVGAAARYRRRIVKVSLA